VGRLDARLVLARSRARADPRARSTLPGHRPLGRRQAPRRVDRGPAALGRPGGLGVRMPRADRGHPAPVPLAQAAHGGSDRRMTMATTDLQLAFRNVSKWYGQISALTDVSFTCSGGVTGLVGQNGAGNSTILKLACGLLAPSQGSVEVG